MGKFSIKINTILPGWSSSDYFYSAGQFQSSIGIDPEMGIDDSSTKPCGMIRPTSMEKFSGTEITGTPLWIINDSKTTDSYVYADDGKVHTVASDLTMGTALTPLTNASANGAEYYNNYVYFAKETDIARYGPLDGTPSMTQDFFTSELSLTALSNKTYPSINGVEIPNHPMHVHTANNRLYFGDVNSDGVGILSVIKTKKSTHEGEVDDTVVPSSYNVLDTYYNWYPTCINSLGNELAVGLIEGTDTTIKQSNAKVVFWSTLASDTTYNRIVELPDPLITAMKNVNGVLYVFSGSSKGGMRISRYMGGQSFEEVYYAPDQYPPFQGAADYMINRISWGSKTSRPSTSGSVFALGSKSRALSMGIHNILKSTSSGNNPIVTAIKYLKQGATEQPIIGWKDDSSKGLDKLSTTYKDNIWRSQVYPLGQSGRVMSVRIPLGKAVDSNTIITVKVYTDDESNNYALTTINNTNYPGERYIKLISKESNFKNNFFIEIAWSGTSLCPIALPINIDVETLND